MMLYQGFGGKLSEADPTTDVDDPVYTDVYLIQEQVLEIHECLEKDTVKVILLSENFEKLLTLFKEFRQSKEKEPMFLFWGNFLSMVELLSAFIWGY